MSIKPRPWVPAHLETNIAKQAQQYRELSADVLEAEMHQLMSDHEQYMDYDCLNLYAGTNMMNPRAVQVLAHSIGSRPSLGYPGDKYEMGMHYAEQLEIMAAELLKEVFKCDYAEIRVGSGSLANLYAFMACTKPGDTIMAFSDAAAGHVTHHEAGAAGLYGLNIHEVPFDAQQMTIDLSALHEKAHQLQPKLIIVAGSMCLFPYPVAAVREIADEVGAYVMYDAAHMSGLIAGGQFQQPLAEGAHLITSSTYKSFGGPPSGMILTNDAELAQRLDAIAYPGLTANFDLGKTAALIIAALDMREYGAAYAEMCIANAQALAQVLADLDLPVFRVANKGFTNSQHMALAAEPFGGGTAACRVLEKANILASGIGLPLPAMADDFNGIRLGTQEITRWGLRPEHMGEVAAFIGRVLLGKADPAAVQQEVIAYRQQFTEVHYIRQ